MKDSSNTPPGIDKKKSLGMIMSLLFSLSIVFVIYSLGTVVETIIIFSYIQHIHLVDKIVQRVFYALTLKK